MAAHDERKDFIQAVNLLSDDLMLVSMAQLSVLRYELLPSEEHANLGLSLSKALREAGNAGIGRRHAWGIPRI